MKNYLKKLKSKFSKFKKKEKGDKEELKKRQQDNKNSVFIGLCLYYNGIRLVKCRREGEEIEVTHIAKENFDNRVYSNSEKKFNEDLKEFLSNQDIQNEELNLLIENVECKEKFKFLPAGDEEELKGMIEGEKEKEEIDPDKENTDYAIIGDDLDGQDNKVPVLLVTMPYELINNFINLSKEFSLKTKYIEVVPTALRRLLKYNEKIVPEKNNIVIYFSEDGLFIYLFKGLSLVLKRRIPSIGGIALDKEIAKKADIEVMEAREYRKKIHVRKEPEEQEEKRVYNAIKGILMKMRVEIERSIQYFNNENPESGIDQVFLTGLNLFPDLDAYLSDKLKLQTEFISPFEKFNCGNSIPKEKLDYSYAIAAGLVLREFIE